MQPDAATFRRHVEQYKAVRPLYERMAGIINTILSRAIHDLGLVAIVQTRAKEIPSFAEKTIRKRAKYPDPVNQLTDLCGARVILPLRDDIAPVCAFIRKHFDVDKSGFEDVGERLGVGEFGYLSIHFTVSLKAGAYAGWLSESDQAILPRLCERWTPEDCKSTLLQPGPKYRAEIQVRTLLQHAWAECSHDRMYKGGFDVPAGLKRDVSRIAATLEAADDAFARTIRAVDSYHTHFGAYMTLEARKAEIRSLRDVLTFDSDNPRLADRIARLALSADMADVARDVLEPFVTRWEQSEAGNALRRAAATVDDPHANRDELEIAQRAMEDLRDPGMAAVLLDYGLAQVKLRQVDTGRQHMAWAGKLAPDNSEILTSLADTYADDPDTAVDFYEAAFHANPADPRALAGFVQCKLMRDHDLEVIPMIRPSLNAAMATCRERARVHVYLPQAYYDIGLFALLLGNVNTSLMAYAKAVDCSESDAAILDAWARAGKLRKALDKKLPELEWVCQFLLVARVAKLIRAHKALQDKIGRQEKDPVSTAEALEKSRTDLAALSEQLQSARSALTRAASRSAPAFRPPVVIVAGGCDLSIQVRIQEYAALLTCAFQDFRGTLVSGGTTSGICGIVGDIPSRGDPAMLKVAYMPSAVPPWTKPHPAYTPYYTGSAWFSPLETIQGWVDAIASGLDPTDVRLIGVNGGDLAAVEYRMALALGAHVGVLADSGREASAILEDEDWQSNPNLTCLPHDPQTVRYFVASQPGQALLPATQRETLAIKRHEVYRSKRMQEIRQPGDPALEAWKDLLPHLKQANFGQVDDIVDKLRAIGLTLVEAKGRPPHRYAFSEKEVEILAEMEHGRWNVQKLLDGWRYGEHKDTEAKTHPCILPWADLPEEIRERDRDPVRDLPDDLLALGYEIVPMSRP